MQLFPTRSLLAHLTQRGLTWLGLIRDLEDPQRVVACKGHQSRCMVEGKIYEAYIEPYGHCEDCWLVVGARAKRKRT